MFAHTGAVRIELHRLLFRIRIFSGPDAALLNGRSFSCAIMILWCLGEAGAAKAAMLSAKASAETSAGADGVRRLLRMIMTGLPFQMTAICERRNALIIAQK
jgi:hypothetical protein